VHLNGLYGDFGRSFTIFHKDTIYCDVNSYLYLGSKAYTQDGVYIMKMELDRDEVTQYKLYSPFSNGMHKKWKLFYCDGTASDTNLMQDIIHFITGYFNTKEYSMEGVEKLQHLILKEEGRTFGVLVSPYVIKEICKLFRII
jgi:hypothetical protein